MGREIIAEEAAALHQLSERLDETFDASVECLQQAQQIVVSGLGKSGNIAQKVAATFTSTGTPAIAMHPVEALHGDLGIVTRRHCLLAFSRSGETAELLRFASHFRRLGGPILGVTQQPASRLAEISDHVLTLPATAEAGPLQLAPTTSCVQMLALGDALAMALLDARGLQPEDFAQYHPEGALGRRLLLRASDLMHGGDALPLVAANLDFPHLLLAITERRLGLAVIVEEDQRLLGVFTDGDLRRVFERTSQPHGLTAREAHRLSRRSPNEPPVHASCVASDTLAIECLRLMRDSRITALIVVDDERQPIGVLRLLDLVEAGLG